MAGPPAIAIFVFAATALGSYARNERRERALRRRFEQHLAPDIVRRLVDEPDRLSLDGEARQVTAMFTDIEGFTALTESSDARDVLRVLDDYLAIVTNIVIEHGGMVDKLIGDGMFALLNVPLDLANHVERAVAAAQAIVAATESYRRTPLPAALALGRTRIGIESGMVIVGDVGGGNRIDFTAFGSVVNTASRLFEGLNKDFNTSICIGPSAAAVLGAERVERLAAVQLRGTSAEIEVFTVAGSHSGHISPMKTCAFGCTVRRGLGPSAKASPRSASMLPASDSSASSEPPANVRAAPMRSARRLLTEGRKRSIVVLLIRNPRTSRYHLYQSR
jgi:adenylate cyclase